MRRILLICSLLVTFIANIHAQYNIERLLEACETALGYQDYVVAIQYCNNIISNRPNLYRAWFYRGVAKQSLGDYQGAANDYDKAIQLNPYVHELFRARAANNLSLKQYGAAVKDYTKAISLQPDEREYWFNRALAKFYQGEIMQSRLDLNGIMKRWPDLPNSYSLMAETYLRENKVDSAKLWLERTLKRNPYDGSSWSVLGRIYLQRNSWSQGNDAFSQAIHYLPKVVNNYTYRAMCRVNLNQLRLAMEDFDKAIDMDPNSFLAHYNRGLLRITVGDDNRAIQDFSFVLRHEPRNLQARYNRALLLDRVGDYRSAIDDYTAVLKQFPNFWIGLQNRARCYRRLGMVNRAEIDEFRLLKAQLDKRNGVQQRWSKAKLRSVRRLNDFDIEKYDQWIELPDEVSTTEYTSKTRGYVQNIKESTDLMPMFTLSYHKYRNGLTELSLGNSDVEIFNQNKLVGQPIYISCRRNRLEGDRTSSAFSIQAKLTQQLASYLSPKDRSILLLQRAIAYMDAYDYTAAQRDLDSCLVADSTMGLAYWQQAVCTMELLKQKSIRGEEQNLLRKKAISGLQIAKKLCKESSYIIYDLANIYAELGDYQQAISLYTQVLLTHNKLAEAYYNRGISYILSNQKANGLADLSKAGEEGCYEAYSLMKQYGK